MLQFFKKEKLCIVSIYKYSMYSFLSKFIWIHLYQFIICIRLFGIIRKNIFYNLNITLNYRFISKTINIRSKFFWKCPLDPWHSFSFFHSNGNIWNHFLYFRVFLYFNCPNPLLFVSFLLCYDIRWYNQMEIVKRWIATMVKWSFRTLWLYYEVYLLILIYFDPTLSRYVASYYNTHCFLLP